MINNENYISKIKYAVFTAEGLEEGKPYATCNTIEGALSVRRALKENGHKLVFINAFETI